MLQQQWRLLQQLCQQRRMPLLLQHHRQQQGLQPMGLLPVNLHNRRSCQLLHFRGMR
jgi:hypothetical protein